MNNNCASRTFSSVMVLIPGLLLAGCGGPAVLSRERAPEVVSAPLFELRDSRVAVVLDTTVVRGGPGAWARNASWDEYRFRIRSLSGDKPSLTRISLVDALGKGVDASSARGELIDATKDVEARYREASLEADRSPGVGAKLAAGATGTALGAGAIGAATATSSWAGAAAAAGAGATIIGGAVFLIGAGVMKVVNDTEVAAELKRRHTQLPAVLGPGDTMVVAFFPITPLPSAIEVSYLDGGIERRLREPTGTALSRIHEPTVAQLVRRAEPWSFPPAAKRKLIESGHVRARLFVDGDGDVTGVEILDASSPVFIQEASNTFFEYKFAAGADNRVAEQVIHFRRNPDRP